MTDQREKRIQGIWDRNDNLKAVNECPPITNIDLPLTTSEVDLLRDELSRLQVERDKAIEALRKLSEVVPNALALEEVRDLL